MNDHDSVILCSVGCITISICYLGYVSITHSDGAVLGTVLTAIGGIIGYALGYVQGVRKSPKQAVPLDQ
jgi:hypothetical protein